jgi:hypothetical protein
MLVHFSYNLSVLIMGNASVNGYEYYSSTFTDHTASAAAAPTTSATAVTTASCNEDYTPNVWPS